MAIHVPLQFLEVIDRAAFCLDGMQEAIKPFRYTIRPLPSRLKLCRDPSQPLLLRIALIQH